MNKISRENWNNKLLPCPFCGSKAVLDGASRAFVNGETTKVTIVFCPTCHCRGAKIRLSDYETSTDARNEAVRLWNKRSYV